MANVLQDYFRRMNALNRQRGMTGNMQYGRSLDPSIAEGYFDSYQKNKLQSQALANQKRGLDIQEKGDDLYIPSQEGYKIETFIDGSILTVSDGPWPMFTPDLISIILVTAIQAEGNVLIHQKMFESRLFFVDNLIDMGAQIILCDPHRATVMGLARKQQLRGITMSSPDIRAGVSLLIAALSAKTQSTIHNVEQIDRGYQYIDTRLNALGANIVRVG